MAVNLRNRHLLSLHHTPQEIEYLLDLSGSEK